MDKQAVKDLMFGGVQELMRNSKYYYHSSVGQDYCHWTEDGKTAILDYMHVMGWKLKQAEEADLHKRAKQQTLDALKGESK